MVSRVALLSLHSSPLAPIGTAHAGGMNVYVGRMADELSRRGIRADVFTRRTDPRAPAISLTKDGARIIYLTAGPQEEVPKALLPLHVPAMAEALRSFVRSEGTGYDVIHSHYWLSGLVALRCQAILGAPIVQMFHTLSRVKEFFSGPDPTDSALRFGGERAVLAGADSVLGATAKERDYMMQLYGIAPASYAVIPPGVDLELFSPRDQDESRRELGIEADRVILFVGRPDRIKGLEVLLASMSALTASARCRIKLVVVGDPADAANARYRRVVSRLGLDGSVDFRGVVPQHQLARYYSAADVCAVPSAYESFGMVAVESMACETPVVAFGVGGLSVTVHDGQTGFLARPGCPPDFAVKLRQALASSNLKAMGRQARLSVRRYEWPSIVERTLNHYHRTSSTRPFCCCASAGG